MEKLYRKRITPGGRVVYDEVFQFDEGDPTPGIWWINETYNGGARRWICEKLEDLPKARKLAEMEPYRDEICQAINKVLSQNQYSIDEICTAIFRAVAEKEEKNEYLSWAINEMDKSVMEKENE